MLLNFTVDKSPGIKPLAESMLIQIYVAIYGTRPKWDKWKNIANSYGHLIAWYSLFVF